MWGKKTICIDKIFNFHFKVECVKNFKESRGIPF